MHFGEEAYIVNWLSTYHVNNAVRLNVVRLYLQLLVGGLMSYLRYMCLFTYRTWRPTRIVLCFRLSSSCVSYVASFSGLFFFDCPYD